ncbi:MAG: hypothetical protein ABJE95_39625 [Byssovorax sp.]
MAVVARVEAAEVHDLDAWGERFVTASRLEDVLGPIPRIAVLFVARISPERPAAPP